MSESTPKVTLHSPPHAPNHPSPQASFIPDQSLAHISHFQLESGIVLDDVWLAFKTWGRLNEQGELGLDKATNALVVCHALTGSSDLEDWWGPLVGPSLAFDPSRYFIFCGNILGSPYGTSSPVTINPETGKRWGPEFPETTVRDDVRLQKLVLDHLGVRSIAFVVGGSMGGMSVLEYALLYPHPYVQHIVPIATCDRHSAWGISWGEAQRQSIYSDPKYRDGYYYKEDLEEEKDDPPAIGLAAARMAALLTYRTRESFESRFARLKQESPGLKVAAVTNGVPFVATEQTPAERALQAHNDGHRGFRLVPSNRNGRSKSGTTSPTSVPTTPTTGNNNPLLASLTSEILPAKSKDSSAPVPSERTIFRAQGYLRYQGDKFVNRFDANCYIHITRKMDAHDVSRNRGQDPHPLSKAPRGALVIAISSDGLFSLSEQREIAEAIPDAELVILESSDGHDGFLLEFEQINHHLLKFFRKSFPSIYFSEPLIKELKFDGTHSFQAKKASVFGEAEGNGEEGINGAGATVEGSRDGDARDLTRW